MGEDCGPLTCVYLRHDLLRRLAQFSHFGWCDAVKRVDILQQPAAAS